ncbi:MAG: hypothetical protein ACPGVN_09645, partial [Alphaproteobacteria bacterium]
IALLSALRTLLFFITMMIGSVLAQQTLYGDDLESTKQLSQLLAGGIFFGVPIYAIFDGFAAYIRKTKVAWSLCIPIVVGLIVALFFAYSASRLASAITG